MNMRNCSGFFGGKAGLGTSSDRAGAPLGESRPATGLLDVGGGSYGAVGTLSGSWTAPHAPYFTMPCSTNLRDETPE